MTVTFRGISHILLVVVFATAAVPAARGQSPAYVTGTWNDNAVHFLDSNLNDLSSFPAGSSNPNGIATDGTLIYTGHFTTSEVVAYNFSGVEQFRWSAAIPNLQGMELVVGELATASGATIQFRNPATGVQIRTIPEAPANIEGLAYDGAALWQLDSSVIYATNPADGSIIRTIPNPAAAFSFGGTGLTSSGVNELTVAASTGNWWKISSTDGSILSSGNNGLSMFALKAVPIPEPASIGLLALCGGLMLRGRRRGAAR
jgi:hypothetical protein